MSMVIRSVPVQSVTVNTYLWNQLYYVMRGSLDSTNSLQSYWAI